MGIKAKYIHVHVLEWTDGMKTILARPEFSYGTKSGLGPYSETVQLTMAKAFHH